MQKYNDKLITEKEKERLDDLEILSRGFQLEREAKYWTFDINDPEMRKKIMVYYGFIMERGKLNKLTPEEELYAMVYPPSIEEVLTERIKTTDFSVLDLYNNTEDIPRWFRWVTEDNACEVCQELNGKTYRIFEVPTRPHSNCKCKIIPLNNDAFEVSLYEDYYALDSEKLEKQHIVALKDPLGALMVLIAKTQATGAVMAIYGNTEDGARQNALRHALWNALMTKYIGIERAEKFANSHEVIKEDRIGEKYNHNEINIQIDGDRDINRRYRGDLINDHTKMDLFFNRLGRETYMEMENEQPLKTMPDNSKMKQNIDISKIILRLEEKIDENIHMVLQP